MVFTEKNQRQNNSYLILANQSIFTKNYKIFEEKRLQNARFLNMVFQNGNHRDNNRVLLSYYTGNTKLLNHISGH
jgi:hypothetical protein